MLNYKASGLLPSKNNLNSIHNFVFATILKYLMPKGLFEALEIKKRPLRAVTFSKTYLPKSG